MVNEIDTFSKVLLALFTFFTLGGGIGSLVYGILIFIRNLPTSYNFGIFNLSVASIVLIVISGLLILTFFLGIIRLWKDASMLHIITLLLATILFILLLGIGLLSGFLIRSGHLKKSIVEDIDGLDKPYAELSEDFKMKADYLHKTYECCSRNSTVGKPESCCQMEGCANSTKSDEEKYFQKDCRDVYTFQKTGKVQLFSIANLIVSSAVLVGAIMYGIVYQRKSHAGYAGVSRG